MTLPRWDRGTPGVFCVSGPHAIPVSTALRAGDDRLVLALASGRETLERLQDDSRAAFCLLGAGVAFTAYGYAHLLRAELESAPTVSAVELRVQSVQDHLADGRTEMVDGARWEWTDERAREVEPVIVGELERLAAKSAG